MDKLKPNQFHLPSGELITERPILFQTDMVKAILDGRKTQTRRNVKAEALNWISLAGFTTEFVAHPDNYLCPYGYPGDLLWVRETWAAVGRTTMHYAYKANESNQNVKWKPSIHMPKSAARIWLMVEEIQVEPLQDISEEDAIAEGIEDWSYAPEGLGQITVNKGKTLCVGPPVWCFNRLWASINGEESWDANPWVWVVKFRVLSCSGKPDLQTIQKNYLDILSE